MRKRGENELKKCEPQTWLWKALHLGMTLLKCSRPSLQPADPVTCTKMDKVEDDLLIWL